MMTMDQNSIYKIAYPSGYLGQKQGHNLGFEALRLLPQQLNNPVAILKSATQDNSRVVFTNILDSYNNPVMVAVHLDKNGRVEISNYISSMYGKDNFSKFIEKERKEGRVLYENKEMGLDQLPVAGLQLSGREAKSDPIFNILNNREVVNNQAAGKELWDQVPVNWVDKLNAWRYTAMLTNPKTHIRNIVGNSIFVPVRGLKNVIGTGLEKALKVPVVGRTKAILS